MGRHRQVRTRPRYGRLLAMGASVAVTLTAALGGVGALPTSVTGATTGVAASLDRVDGDAGSDASAGTLKSDRKQAGGKSAGAASQRSKASPKQQSARLGVTVADQLVIEAETTALPADSGSGRRVVFSEEQQRVWLVADDGTVERTYLVSGSIYDNLDPGTYSVYSRSEQAWGIDDSGTMKWFVRFAHGPNAAIGFHDIPIDDGSPVQSLDELGTPLSHGCIRQRTTDALAMWEFAPIGTTVVVV